MFAVIHEIFSSIQGEGPWLGQRQIFVRFAGCDIACRYCDTPLSAGATPEEMNTLCRAQQSPKAFTFEEMPGRMSANRLVALCSRLYPAGPGRPVISLTGGEPLLHESFLQEWLPLIRTSSIIYLETNGVRPDAMARLRSLVDLISMDFKLPSATGLKPFWEEHGKFLAAAQDVPLFVKAVVTADTDGDDITRSARIIADHDPAITFVIQPASGSLAPGPELLMEFQNQALSILQDVRVIPQVHGLLGVP